MKTKAMLATPLAVLLMTASASAIDRNEASFARVTTGVLFLTMMCPDYRPLPDVLNYMGKQSMGPDRTKKVLLAVGAEVARIMRQGGMKLGPGGDPANLDPEISKIVDENLSGLMDLYRVDKEKACREVGDLSVKNGVAEKVK
jgi:hypothetical protein